MGGGEFGGDGSVAWRIDIDDETRRGRKRAAAYGRDPKNAETFTIALEYSTPRAARKDFDRLTRGPSGLCIRGSTIVFEVDVQPRNEDQIRIRW